MNYQRLKHTFFFVGIISAVFFSFLQNFYADMYDYGKIVVSHEELTVKKNGRPVQFNHPCELPGNVITNILSYIYFEEKGLLKKKVALRVFQDDEIRKLTPLLVQAFSVAKPTQVVAVSSYSERLLLTDQQNCCVMFVSDNKLNIVFSRIHTLQTYNDSMSDKKKYTVPRENAVRIKRSRFWKIVPTTEQQCEPGHENWLIIDLSHSLYQQPVAQRVGTVDEKIKVGTSDLDERLKKLEEKMNGGINTIPGQPGTMSTPSPAGGSIRESKVKSKLILLREMVHEGIISEDDYDDKKAKLLREAMTDMGIKDQLREIKELKADGLITEDDYNEKKKELLDLF